VLRQTTTLAIVLLTLYVARTFIGNALAAVLKPIYRLLPPAWVAWIDWLGALFQ